MEIPGLTFSLYGMTKAEAFAQNLCISCKNTPTFYSTAGAKEYSISGLCEPCFDKITGGTEEDTMHKNCSQERSMPSSLSKELRDAFTLNMNGQAVSFAALLRMLHTLEWRMNPAQLFGIELQSAFIDGTVIELTRELTAEEAEVELIKTPTKHSLMGIPVLMRQDYPKGWIRLYAGNKLIAHMDNAAIPCMYGNDNDPNWGTPLSEDNVKAKKILEEDDKE
jgi:hypothetical protein